MGNEDLQSSQTPRGHPTTHQRNREEGGREGRATRNWRASRNTRDRLQVLLMKHRTLHLETSETIPRRFGKSHKVEIEGHHRGSTKGGANLKKGSRREGRKVLVCNGGSKVISN